MNSLYRGKVNLLSISLDILNQSVTIIEGYRAGGSDAPSRWKAASFMLPVSCAIALADHSTQCHPPWEGERWSTCSQLPRLPPQHPLSRPPQWRPLNPRNQRCSRSMMRTRPSIFSALSTRSMAIPAGSRTAYGAPSSNPTSSFWKPCCPRDRMRPRNPAGDQRAVGDALQLLSHDHANGD